MLYTPEFIATILHFIVNSASDVQYGIALAEYFTFSKEFRDLLRKGTGFTIIIFTVNSDLPEILLGLLKSKDRAVQAACLSFLATNMDSDTVQQRCAKVGHVQKLSELFGDGTQDEFVYFHPRRRIGTT